MTSLTHNILNIKISVPTLKLQKMIRSPSSESLYQFKKTFVEKIGLKDPFNYGFLHLSAQGYKFLNESQNFVDQGITSDVSVLIIIARVPC